MRSVARPSTLLACALLLNACSGAESGSRLPWLPSSDAAARLQGLWYGNATVAGEGTPGDVLLVNNSDGSFVAYFRLCAQGAVDWVTVETGTWSLSGNVQTSVTLSVDGQEAPRTDYFVERYRLRWLDADTVEKTLERDGTLFKSRRVRAGFQLPPEPCKNL
ncbi:hypothetical protein DFR29_11230 [Tahibacter aquaticus]|uniref:Lipocalin-like protein n=1 Tax=Tahibacter aquaticus TaxID=520092 RepID=A0A4R6YRK5_9GAMM|nr:lipocalin family protein [Tahibacter aquaticus]TDR40716.1 hypothetical protein DFR29_11230 [Tahibacter aquaticus]